MRKARAILGAVAALSAGATLFYLRERNSETPDYDLLDEDGAFSLRLYETYLVAETVRRGTRNEALDRGFAILAAYIFAKGRRGPKIAMTAPVTAEAADSDSWRISFVMPAKWTRASLPEPGPGVTISERRERKVAVIKFSGVNSPDLVAAKEADLRDWIAGNEWAVTGDAEYAFYNSPFIPGPLRRNEVMIPVGG